MVVRCAGPLALLAGVASLPSRAMRCQLPTCQPALALNLASSPATIRTHTALARLPAATLACVAATPLASSHQRLLLLCTLCLRIMPLLFFCFFGEVIGGTPSEVPVQ